MRQETVWLETSDGVRLEGVWHQAREAKGAAVVLHPHPQYGGSMDNNVVDALVRGALQAGWSALRFNFRGVGASSGGHGQGAGEVADVLAAAAWVKGHCDGPLALMGYSFGTLVGSLAAKDLDPLVCGMWVSPPLVLGELQPWPEQAGPLLITVGEADQYTDLKRLRDYAKEMGARCRLMVQKSVDHFWWGGESELIGEAVNILSHYDHMQV